MNTQDAYAAGFVKCCEDRGIDPEQLVKQALGDRPSWVGKLGLRLSDWWNKPKAPVPAPASVPPVKQPEPVTYGGVPLSTGQQIKAVESMR